MHGGRCKGGSLPGHDTSKATAARAQVVELRHAMGLKWYGGRPAEKRKVLAMAEKAVVVADAVLETLPAVRQIPDDEKGPAELLNEGMRAALIAGRDICRAFDPEADIKERRLVSDTAGWVSRLGMRVAEGELRSRKSDAVDRLIAEIASGRTNPPPSQNGD
jgi:hypothetical protein